MKNRRNQARSGFTLAELMVVIVIIGLLATLVVPNVIRRLASANTAKAKADIVAISGALNEYAIENGGRYPDSLEALVTPDQNGHTFLQSDVVPKDPWGNPYAYEPGRSGSQSFRVISYGKDGAPGGEGDDRDLDNVMIANQEL